MTDAINETTKKHFGYSTFGYWKLFETEEAVALLDNHVSLLFLIDGHHANMILALQIESVTSLVYPAEPTVFKTNLGPVGAAESWIRSNKTSSRPTWLTSEEVITHNEVLSKKGYRGPLNWYDCFPAARYHKLNWVTLRRRYKSTIWDIDLVHNASVPEERKHVNLPTLLVVSDNDYATRADIAKNDTAKWVKQLRIEELSCGHWVQLELPEDLTRLLEGFANEFN